MTDQEIVEKLIKEKFEHSDLYFDFEGKNCEDFGACAGWDGSDRRCECGNRRVSWELSDDKTYITAVAW